MAFCCASAADTKPSTTNSASTPLAEFMSVRVTFGLLLQRPTTIDRIRRIAPYPVCERSDVLSNRVAVVPVLLLSRDLSIVLCESASCCAGDDCYDQKNLRRAAHDDLPYEARQLELLVPRVPIVITLLLGRYIVGLRQCRGRRADDDSCNDKDPHGSAHGDLLVDLVTHTRDWPVRVRPCSAGPS